MGVIRVFSPEGRPARILEGSGSSQTPGIPRVLGLLSNQKPNSTPLLQELGKLLGDLWPGLTVVFRTKPNQGTPVPPAVFSELRGCDAVICGVGD